MTESPDQRSEIESVLTFSNTTTPTSSERAIGDIAGSLRRIAQRGAIGAGAGGPAGLQRRVEALRSEILGTRGSTNPDQVRRALAGLGPGRGAPPRGPVGGGPRNGAPSGGMAGVYGGGYRTGSYGGYAAGSYGDGASGSFYRDGYAGMTGGGRAGRPAATAGLDGAVLSASHQVLVARVTELTSSMEGIVKTLQPIQVEDPPEPAAVEATRALICSVLASLAEESRRLEPRPNIVDAALGELALQLERFTDQMAPEGAFESDADRRQEAQLELLAADAADLVLAWNRFFVVPPADRVEQVERVRRQLRTANGTLGRLRDALRDAGLSDEEADSPEARLSVLEAESSVVASGSSGQSGDSLPEITLAAWLDSVEDATGDAAQARLNLGGDFALELVVVRASAIQAEAARLLELIANDGDDSSILTALGDPIAVEELNALQEQMESVAELAGPPGQQAGQARIT
jgi:hypothetical protein